ncbi:enoyl-CoA hydratase-related protein [Chachezhania sediminis]|uniref:enoyl-CoA hydratase-related protein n=1 Tax=Chachezhania sediminis TaxID=2599291 RepID=UPI00131DF13E|nr:enoyl-CoA hydratase-related protein [Chachezhania sediminis]
MTDTAFPPDWTPDRTFGDGRVGLRIADGIAVLAIQIPDKMNALDDAATGGMIEALDAARDKARVLLFTGVGGRAFISGADIGGFDGPQPTGQSFLDRQRALANYPLPTVAVIRGYCLGGGLMTALNCDFRLAATDASFGVPAAKLGISYGSAGLARLVECIGPARTRRLLYVGDRVDAATAHAWGLVEHVYAPDALWDAAMAMARTIAGNAPLSVRATKATVADLLLPESRQDPGAILALSLACRDSRDFEEGRAAFREKRKPAFEGR